MWSIVPAVLILLAPALGDVISEDNPNADPVSRQLIDYAQKTPNPGVLTTSSGRPVDVRDTNTLNSDLITNQFFMDTITHVTNEKIPARVAVAKGTGAFGYFEVTNDITKYSKAKLFSKVGKRTPLLARLGVSQVGATGSDTTTVALRGFSLKFYTEDGNLDILNSNIPVFLTRDPLLFAPLLHTFGFNPRTNMRDISQALDFITLKPAAFHGILWETSELGLPRGYRYMNAFPIHTFPLYNEKGDVHFVRFKFITTLGYQSLSLEEARQLQGTDPDFFVRDFYNSIERKKYPAWRMEMDVLTKDLKDLDFDPFDVTRLWNNGTYKTVEIGRIVLNRNVDNHFAQVEQAGFNPAHLVPGIAAPIDKLFKGRIIAYTDAQIYRLGINHNKIEVNCPLYAKNYNRDGVPPVLDNGRDAPNYMPNSFNGPIPIIDVGKPNKMVDLLESNAADLEPARRFYNEALTTVAQRQRLVDNLVQISLRVSKPLIERLIASLYEIDKDLGTRFKNSLEIAKEKTRLPSVVEDLPQSKVRMSKNNY